MSWALVTGGAARGGAAIARALHRAGVDVLVHHSPRSRSTAQALEAELDAVRPQSARTWEAELSTDVAVPEWIVQLAPACCICNASTYQPSALDDVLRMTEDHAIHVRAHAAILGALRPGLRSVVAVSDVHAERPTPGYVWYSVTKAALQALVLTLAVEWAPDVRCNVVAPGTLPYPDRWNDPERGRRVQASIPLQRLGTFDELAAAVAWLALDAHYVTGQVLAVDGGRSRWLA